MLQISNFNSVMESETISKNRASSKTQMSKRNRLLFFSGLLFTLFLILESCAVATLRARQANLSDGYKFSAIGLQWQQELIEKKEVISSIKPYNWYVFYGLGMLNFDDKREGGYLNGFSSPKLGLNFGLGANYLLLKGRTQPYIGLDLDGTFHQKGDNTVYYMGIVPHIGIRYFISLFTALTGNVGYSIGSVSKKPLLETENEYYNVKGITYSIGLSYVF